VSPFLGDGLVGLPPAPSSGWLPEELGRVHIQDRCQFPDDLQPDVGHGPLDAAHVGAVDLGIVGQLLLGQLPLVPEPG
jgi:hypothetical protein